MNRETTMSEHLNKGKSEMDSHWIDFASKEEKDTIHEEINMFGTKDEPWQALVVKNDVYIFIYRKGNMEEVHLMPRGGKDRFKGLMGNPGLEYFGLFIGFLKGDQFNLSLEGGAELVRKGGCSRNYVKLTWKGEKSFLYGNDIHKEEVKEVGNSMIDHDRGICLVLNNTSEFIGIAKLVHQDPSFETAAPDDQVLRTLVDNGMYLRKGH